jgi:hypothetical protein
VTQRSRRTTAPRPSRRARAWRINGDAWELVPVGLPAARARGLDVCELRRKADDRRVALLWWRGRADGSAAVLRPEAGCTREALGALAALGPDWVASASARGSIRVESERAARTFGRTRRSCDARGRGANAMPRLAAIALPGDYAQQTGLPLQHEPVQLALADPDAFGRAAWLCADTAAAWIRLRDAALADGVVLQLVSAFRHVAYQTRLFERKMARGQTVDEILRVNAAPGYSEHHSGRAIDITTPGSEPAGEAFEATPAFAWLQANASSHGFRLSYPRGNPHGVIYEPWHWMHVPG